MPGSSPGTCLGVQLRHLGFPADLRGRRLIVERLGQVLDGLPLPLGDLVGVKLVLCRQLRKRPLTADRLKRNLGLELSREPSACLHAGSSFSSVDPPYAPVSETETTPEFIASDFVVNTSTRARTLNGTSSSDVLFGGRGHDLIDGNGGKDKLLGGVGDDDIYAEAGNDQIWGGAGSDLMSGGIGDDLFRFASVSEMTSSSERDIITDFQINDGVGYDDLIDFSRIDADPTRSGNQAFDFIGRDTSISYSPGELRYYYGSHGDTIVAGNIDNDSASEFQIVLEGHHV